MTVQKQRFALDSREINPAFDPAITRCGPNLPQPLAERPAYRHADRPAKFNHGNIPPHDPAIIVCQGQQPVPNRLRAVPLSVEHGGQLFHGPNLEQIGLKI